MGDWLRRFPILSSTTQTPPKTLHLYWPQLHQLLGTFKLLLVHVTFEMSYAGTVCAYCGACAYSGACAYCGAWLWIMRVWPIPAGCVSAQTFQQSAS